MAAGRDEILAFCDAELDVRRYRDYGPIGLQVAGSERVERIAAAVSVTRDVLQATVDAGAQLLLVHHGLFWDRDPRVVDELMRERLRLLIDGGVTLAAYHLPLDGHPEIGNNALLARHLGLLDRGRFAEHGGVEIGVHGRLPEPLAPDELGRRVEQAVGRAPLVLPGSRRVLRTVGIVSGGAGSDIAAAARLGLDAFVTGEPEEPSAALARELDVAFYAAGHHAGERLGIRALADRVAERFALSSTFVDSDNPV